MKVLRSSKRAKQEAGAVIEIARRPLAQSNNLATCQCRTHNMCTWLIGFLREAAALALNKFGPAGRWMQRAAAWDDPTHAAHLPAARESVALPLSCTTTILRLLAWARPFFHYYANARAPVEHIQIHTHTRTRTWRWREREAKYLIQAEANSIVPACLDGSLPFNLAPQSQRGGLKGLIV